MWWRKMFDYSLIYADRYAGGCRPEQQKQSKHFQISREGEDYPAPHEQRVYEEGPEQADQRECHRPVSPFRRSLEGELWNDL